MTILIIATIAMYTAIALLWDFMLLAMGARRGVAAALCAFWPITFFWFLTYRIMSGDSLQIILYYMNMTDDR